MHVTRRGSRAARPDSRLRGRSDRRRSTTSCSRRRFRIVPEATRRPSFGFRMATKLPNASNQSGLGTDMTDVSFAVLVGKTIRSVRVVGNLGVAIIGDPTQTAVQYDPTIYGLSLARALAPGFDVVTEIEGRWQAYKDTPQPAAENRAAVRGGLRLHARRGARRRGPEHRVRRRSSRASGSRPASTWVLDAFRCALTGRRHLTVPAGPHPRPAADLVEPADGATSSSTRSALQPNSCCTSAAHARTTSSPGWPAAPSPVRRTTTSSSVIAISCRTASSTCAPVTGQALGQRSSELRVFGVQAEHAGRRGAVHARDALDRARRIVRRGASLSSARTGASSGSSAVRLAAIVARASRPTRSMRPLRHQPRGRVLRRPRWTRRLRCRLVAWSRTSARSSSAGGCPSRSLAGTTPRWTSDDLVEAERQPRKCGVDLGEKRAHLARLLTSVSSAPQSCRPV